MRTGAGPGVGAASSNRDESRAVAFLPRDGQWVRQRGRFHRRPRLRIISRHLSGDVARDLFAARDAGAAEDAQAAILAAGRQEHCLRAGGHHAGGLALEFSNGRLGLAPAQRKNADAARVEFAIEQYTGDIADELRTWVKVLRGDGRWEHPTS
ncbi:hypothetical protein [Kitasatospora sp. NPDC093679]|uniref:hypothetical protein n=1 Tax=Kitasatospora sp. NPDC093679 TaxID=3154983 RepID=UPI003434C12C